MTTAFIPTKGTYFYVRMKPYKRVVMSLAFGEPDQVVEQVDRSYLDNVFLCTGRDDCAVTATRVVGYGSGDVRIFRHFEAIYQPVGPEILSALGLVAEAAE